MGEYGAGQLHSGSSSGPVVNDQKQALAIAYSEQKRLGQKKALRAMGKKRRG